MSIFLTILAGLMALGSFLHTVVAPVLVVLAKRRLLQRNENRKVSRTPLLGSTLGFLALLLAPIATVSARLKWAWVPLLVEAVMVSITFAYWKLSGLAEAERQRRERQP